MFERMNPSRASRRRGRHAPRLAAAILVLLLGALGAPVSRPAWAADLASGEVLVGLGFLSSPGRGEVKHFSSSGVLIQSLVTGSGSFEETGMCFDGSGNLYTTNFDVRSMSKFDTHAVMDTGFAASFIGLGDPSGTTKGAPSSCVVDASQNPYVGNSDGVGPFFGGGEQAVLAFRTPDPRKSYLVQKVRGSGQHSSH